ncbi:MAG: ABC transporter ATP-binding protein [Clostridia bacterium]|nr:ABC transporter ATP-binding protein [Clostridia bacterium]
MIEINDLCVMAGKKEILNNITLSVPRGKFTAILGKHGSGKSTLISCIASSIRYSGSIKLDGRLISKIPPRTRARLISVLPQHLTSTDLTVRELVSLGRSAYTGITARLSSNDEEMITRALAVTDMTDLADIAVAKLSGGERQSAFIAMTIAQDANVMIFDEPTTYMDAKRAFAVSDLLLSFVKSDNKTVVAVMHDINRALTMADNVVVLEGGKVIFSGSPGQCKDLGIPTEHFGLTRIEDIQGREFFIHP